MTQVSEAPARTRAQIAEGTLRKDRWWQAPAVTAVLLSIWVGYATVRVFTGHWYFVEQYHYLTPFYSPCVNGECVPGSSSLGTWIPAVPPIIPYAFVSLPFVLGFRLSCYYYRRAYYRAFWRSPAACAVREPHAKYSGETKFPLIMQNLHRYFFYMVVADLDPEHLGRGAGVPRAGRELRVRPRLADHPRQRHPAVGVHAVVPHLPAHHGRAAQALLQAPGPVLGVDAGLQAQRQAHAARVDDARHAHADRPVHHAGRGARLQRPANLQLDPETGNRYDRRSSAICRHRALLLRRGSDRRWRLRAAGGDRGARSGQEDRDHLQVPVRQGAHRHGRGRRGRRDGQRQPEGQLAGPLPRHDARREVPEQPADGRAARQGGPGPRLGAGGVGRDLRPDQGREDQPAQLRRARRTRGWRTWATGPAWR